MSRLDDYRSALLAADPDQSAEALVATLQEGGDRFAAFVIDHGLGPLWHLRTDWPAFRDSRLAAEAKFLAQEHALRQVDEVLEAAGVEYAVIKGTANRLLLYDNPAIRACHDIDVLVNPKDRVGAAKALAGAGFVACRDSRNISRALVLTSRDVDIDLHWGLLREGRLRADPTTSMLDRRRRTGRMWMLSPEDALFVLLVHPVFAKHLAGYGMGLHRVLDVVRWLETQSFDWPAVVDALEEQGLRTAAWATLRWVEIIAERNQSGDSPGLIEDVAPGGPRAAWLNRWLEGDLSQRTAGAHWLRLLAFSVFLHDTPGDSLRALAGRYRSHHRRGKDMADFGELLG
jgi:hypothetical protein